LEAPLFVAPGFLVSAAAHSLQISVAALLGLAIGGLSLGIAITAFPIIRPYSQAMALWFVALGAVSLALAAGENMTVMSMLSVSEAYVKSGAGSRDEFETFRIIVASARNWAHYIGLIVAGGTFFVFYAALFRFALVPRALAFLGLVGVILQITAVA